VLVEPGSYTESDEITLDRSGTAEAPITLRSRVQGQAHLHSPGANNVFAVRGGDHNVVQDFEISGGKYCGIYIVTGNHLKVLGNHIHHTGTAPVHEPYGQEAVLSESGTRGHLYAGNLIHHNGRPRSVEPQWDVDHGMYLCGDDETVVNNVIAFNRDNAIQVAGYRTVSNLRVHHNVLAGNGHGGLVLWLALKDVSISNNIFHDNGRDQSFAGLWSYDAHGTGVEIVNNCFWGNTGGAVDTTGGGSDYQVRLENVLEFDPLFVNPEAINYRLRGNSPAIDAGVVVPGIDTDLLGKPRVRGAAPDLGPYEIH